MEELGAGAGEEKAKLEILDRVMPIQNNVSARQEKQIPCGNGKNKETTNNQLGLRDALHDRAGLGGIGDL
jgi:hypothetical protein